MTRGGEEVGGPVKKYPARRAQHWEAVRWVSLWTYGEGRTLIGEWIHVSRVGQSHGQVPSGGERGEVAEAEARTEEASTRRVQPLDGGLGTTLDGCQRARAIGGASVRGGANCIRTNRLMERGHRVGLCQVGLFFLLCLFFIFLLSPLLLVANLALVTEQLALLSFSVPAMGLCRIEPGLGTGYPP